MPQLVFSQMGSFNYPSDKSQLDERIRQQCCPSVTSKRLFQFKPHIIHGHRVGGTSRSPPLEAKIWLTPPLTQMVASRVPLP